MTSTSEKECNVLVVAEGPLGDYCPEISCNSKLFEKIGVDPAPKIAEVPPLAA